MLSLSLLTCRRGITWTSLRVCWVFGLSSAPFVFTKVLKILIKHWHSFGIRIFAFIDDGLVGGIPWKRLQGAQILSSQI